MTGCFSCARGAASLSHSETSSLRAALTGASAALVRAEIASRSCSATAARIWIVNLVAVGLSQQTKSTLRSINIAMNVRLRLRRSSLAMTNFALCLLQAASAFATRAGRCASLSISVNSSSNVHFPPSRKSITALRWASRLRPGPCLALSRSIAARILSKELGWGCTFSTRATATLLRCRCFPLPHRRPRHACRNTSKSCPCA